MINKLRINIFFTLLLLLSSSIIYAQKELEESKKRGEDIYSKNCTVCHMVNGEGLTGAFPPLAKSDYLMEDTKRAAVNIINGVSGEMKVNGVLYYGAMGAYSLLSNQDIADVLNYIRNSWENKGDLIEAKTIQALRK